MRRDPSPLSRLRETEARSAPRVNLAPPHSSRTIASTWIRSVTAMSKP